jgi:hypothetical protein
MCGLCACGSAAAPAPHHAAVEQDRPYLKLIEPDNEWTLPIIVKKGHHDVHGTFVDKREHGQVHCRIKSLERIGDAAVSHLACDKPYDDLSINGTWVAEPAGLYHPLGPITQPDDLATLVDDDLLINNVPRERDHSHTTDNAERVVEAFPWQTGWCVHDKTSDATAVHGEFTDRRSFTLCFDRKTGILAASELDSVQTEGTFRVVHIGVAPPLDFDDPTKPVESEEKAVPDF